VEHTAEAVDRHSRARVLVGIKRLEKEAVPFLTKEVLRTIADTFDEWRAGGPDPSKLTLKSLNMKSQVARGQQVTHSLTISS
jgi:hypothetical protein